MRFHIDACQPRHPEGEGKVERGIRDQREALDPCGQVFDSIEDLQTWTDAGLDECAMRLRCPATGTSVTDAWEQERQLLTPLPETLPQTFDLVVRRPVGMDCMVSFEGRQYSVPFRFVRQEVEVRGLAGRVQMLKDCEVIAEHPRSTDRLILRDEAHYEGMDNRVTRRVRNAFGFLLDEVERTVGVDSIEGLLVGYLAENVPVPAGRRRRCGPPHELPNLLSRLGPARVESTGIALD